MAQTPMLRRLNDAPRYWGLTITGWAGVATGVGVLYGAARLSPFGFKPTVTVVLFVLAVVAVVFLGVSGQALSPGRQLRAIWRYRRSPHAWTLAPTADRRGVVLSTAPDLTSVEDLGDVDDDWMTTSEHWITAGLEGDD